MAPVVQFLLTAEQSSEQFSILRGSVAPGVIVPLHSHPDTEWITMLEGQLQVLTYQQNRPVWIDVTSMESIVIPSNARHAIRNVSSKPAVIIMACPPNLGHFFEELGHPIVPGGKMPELSPEIMQKFFELQARYGYWMGSPEENAAAGITL